MPLKYESQEFSEELRKRLNVDREYREKAKGMTWKTLFIVEDIHSAVYSNYLDGELVERKRIPPSQIEECRKKADFVVGIPTYELSVEIAAGRKSLETLFMSGTLKVEGSVFKALRYRGAIELAGKVTAQLTNELSIPSKEDFAKMLSEQALL
jgi:putative sterol carrier protein